jgi:hypothetical protein
LWDISISTTRHDLEVVGASIYEFHDQFGRWPASADDLARTSLSAKMPYWRTILSAGTVVIEWPKSIDPLPHNNTRIVLAYYNRGLISAFGHKWVCWGDLRTEYVADARLQGAIATQVH